MNSGHRPVAQDMSTQQPTAPTSSRTARRRGTPTSGPLRRHDRPVGPAGSGGFSGSGGHGMLRPVGRPARPATVTIPLSAEDTRGTRLGLGSWMMTDIDDHTDEITMDEVIDPDDSADDLDRAPADEDEETRAARFEAETLPYLDQLYGADYEIGRASCRERV